eukprot:CCRYP_008811-RB/>CCRYP_008811-RB protein AED:0.07 eAED:0.07 QI:462/1/1/1/0.5/0.33/3/21/522
METIPFHNFILNNNNNSTRHKFTMDSSSEEETNKTKLRISLHLAPGVKPQNADGTPLEVPADPIAVPSDIRKRGLSAVVNHLLGRRVADQEDDDENSVDQDDEDLLPPIPFDFLLSSKLLRLPLDAAVRKEGLSTEHAVELFYFPARLPPIKEGEGESVPDWIMSMDYFGSTDGKWENGLLFTGCADGVVRSFSCDNGGLIQPSSSIAAHTGPIHCLSTIKFNCESEASPILVATGSMDQTLVTHQYMADNEKSSTGTLDLHAVYSGGHSNSISSVALCNNGSEGSVMASGDWDGGLALWNIPTESIGEVNETPEDESSANKRLKGSNQKHIRTKSTTIREVKPRSSTKAHSSNISGICFGYNNPNTILTSSWDHSLKVYDTQRMDCILSMNGSRVVTSMSRCINGNVVGTGCADCMVRLWDMRVGGAGNAVGSVGHVADKTLRQSHKSWVSGVEWSPTDPFVLASTSHDGTLKVWDIRSSIPLHTVKATKKGEKALCLAFGKGSIYSGGSDCVVNKFTCKV